MILHNSPKELLDCCITMYWDKLPIYCKPKLSYNLQVNSLTMFACYLKLMSLYATEKSEL